MLGFSMSNDALWGIERFEPVGNGNVAMENNIPTMAQPVCLMHSARGTPKRLPNLLLAWKDTHDKMQP